MTMKFMTVCFFLLPPYLFWFDICLSRMEMVFQNCEGLVKVVSVFFIYEHFSASFCIAFIYVWSTIFTMNES